jgi:cysteine desulfurase/selenocysteine lyase
MQQIDEFGPFGDHVWLNCAHQGPLPRVAVEEARHALDEKVAPYLMQDESFDETPARLKAALGRLVGVPAEEIILGNSTAYGLNLLVQGLPLGPGDEVLLVDGDFPSTIVTWLPLRKRGIGVRLFRPRRWPPTPEEIEEEITPATRVLCSSWVFSFFGSALDLGSVGALCRRRGVLFVVNGSQAIGTRVIDLSSAPVDALVGCGFKWQCGPYGTGFAWIRQEILQTLQYVQAYWLAHDGTRSTSYGLRDDLGTSAYDVFGTANFVNFRSWTAAVELLLSHGIGNIQRHNDDLVDRLVRGLEELSYILASPRSGPTRRTLVLFGHEDQDRNLSIARRLEHEEIHIAERDGKLRISPHLYNTPEDIERSLQALGDLA